MLNQLFTHVYDANRGKGFWEDLYTTVDAKVGKIGTRMFLSEKLLLVVGELSEAQEELRKNTDPSHRYYTDKGGEVTDQPLTPLALRGKYVNYRNKPEGFPVEVADAFIRLCDIMGWLNAHGLDMESIVNEKLEYNSTREHRHGKSF